MENFILRIIGLYLNVLGRISYNIAGKQGAFLFCYAVRPKMAKKHISHLEEALSETIPINEDQINLYKWGTGPKKMLLVHGWSSHSFRWKKYIDKFDLEEYTIYAFDCPGHGLSSGNQFNLPKMGIVLNAILTKLGKIDILMGHSIGAFSCLFALHKYKEHKVERLILLASPGRVTEWVDQYKKKMRLRAGVEQAIYDHFLVSLGYEISYFHAGKFAKDLKMEGLIIHDKEDKDTSFKYSQEVHEAWPMSTLVLTTGKGHKLNQEEIILLIRDYLDRKVVQTNYPVYTKERT